MKPYDPDEKNQLFPQKEFAICTVNN